jgi:peptidoglycan-associated lipoprotein
MNIPTRSLKAALPIAAVLALAACASKQTTAAAPIGVTAMQPRDDARTSVTTVLPPNTSTASNVHISDEILGLCNIPDSEAYFAFDSSSITTFDRGPLEALGRCFSTGPLSGRHMKLVGHADPRGTPDYNMTLGQSRADAVEQYLERSGLPFGRVSSSSRGAMDAIGHDETGWAHDRRVDVTLVP